MGDSLTNIIFVAVALLAWAIKVAVERKERQTQQGPQGRRGEPGLPRDSGEVDLIVGRAPLPDAIVPQRRLGGPHTGGAAPTGLPEAPPLTVAKPLARSRGRQRGRVRKPLPSIESPPSSQDAGTYDQLRRLPRTRPGSATLSVRSETSAVSYRGRGGYVRALERLGIAKGGGPRDMLRVGVLWSEVLGVPRALAGPHCPPAARRMRNRRASQP